MKKNHWIIGLLIVIYVLLFAPKSERIESEFMQINIEALTYPEVNSDIHCFGKGKIECPNGVKVEWYINGTI